MENLPKDVLERYDRQIRLFGFDVQRRILETSVVILQGNTFKGCERSKNSAAKDYPLVSGEIIKNFALLGFCKIYLNREALSSFKRISPHDIKSINEKIETKVVAEGDVEELSSGNQIVALVDHPSSFIGSHVYFVCSSCYSFHPAFETHNACTRDLCQESIAMECMIGSLFVHEMVKMLKGEEYQKNFKLEI